MVEPMVFRDCFLLLTLSVATACSSASKSEAKQPSASAAELDNPVSLPTKGAKAVSAFPRVHIDVENFTADEGETWTYDISPDGAFVGGGSMSNGGSEDTVWSCKGHLPQEGIGGWLDRLKSLATLVEAPRLPGIDEALERGQELGFIVGLAKEDGTTSYADPGRLDKDLNSLFEQLQAARTCTTSTE